MVKFLLKGNLKRHFFVLSAVVTTTVVILLCLTLYSNQNITQRELDDDLSGGVAYIKSVFDNNFYYIEDRLESLAKGLVKIDSKNLELVNDVLATSRVIDNTALGPIPYTNFDWVTPKGKMVVNTTLGILKEPRDMSFRNYLTKSQITPNKIIIDEVVVGVPSGKLLIPISIGIEDKAGTFLGTLTTGVDIERLNNLVKEGLPNAHVRYIIFDAKFTDVAKNWVNMKSEPIAVLAQQLRNLHLTDAKNRELKDLPESIRVENYLFSKLAYTGNGQYLILVGYDRAYLFEMLLKKALPVLAGIVFIGLLVIAFVVIVYRYIVNPVIELGKIAQDISLGKKPGVMPKSRISEVFLLSKQMIKIRSYIGRYSNTITILHEKQREIAAQKESLEYLTKVIDDADKANELILRDIRHTTSDGLNVINLSAALLASYFKGEAKKKLKTEEIINALENIQTEVKHIQTFTTDCLSFEMVNPVQLLEDVIIVKRKPILKRGVILHTDIPKELPSIAVDRVRFNQIISGIIDRSISFLETGHQITVSLSSKNIKGIKYIECSVQDDGFGIKQQSRENFIDKNNFESLDGINLSIKSIEKLVFLHGGILAIKDSAGVGSNIIVTIPYRTISNVTKSERKSKNPKDSNVVSLFE